MAYGCGLLHPPCLSIQAGLDDTAKAAGLTAGHIESTVEMTVENTKKQVVGSTHESQMPAVGAGCNICTWLAICGSNIYPTHHR